MQLEAVVEGDGSSALFKNHKLDIHVFYESKLVLVIECKSYLDSCYLSRAVQDFNILYFFDYNVRCLLIALQNCVSESAMNLYKHLDKTKSQCFILLNEKRESKKPLYRNAEYSFDKRIITKLVCILYEIINLT